MASLTQQYRELEADLAAKLQHLESLKEQVGPLQELVALVKDECAAKGFTAKDVAIELYPELAKFLEQQPAVKVKGKRQPRKVKVYINPHTHERIETKGGNHTGLKAWKQQYGAAQVELWLER